MVVSSPTPLGMSMLHVRGATTTARPSPPLPARVGICWNNYALCTNDSRRARSCVVVLFGVLSDRKAGRSTYLGGGSEGLGRAARPRTVRLLLESIQLQPRT